MGSAPGRPVKTHGPLRGPGGAAHIEPTSHGPRPGPAHPISSRWAAALPSPSNFQSMGRGPAQPMKIAEDGPRPGPAHHIFNSSRPGPARPRQTAHDQPWKISGSRWGNTHPCYYWYLVVPVRNTSTLYMYIPGMYIYEYTSTSTWLQQRSSTATLVAAAVRAPGISGQITHDL